MSDVPGIDAGDADPQSQLPAGHLKGDSEPVDGACSSSRTAPEDTALTPAETSVPGGGGRYRTRSQGHPLINHSLTLLTKLKQLTHQ